MIHVPAITEIPVYKTIIAKEINFTACFQKYVNLIFYFQQSQSQMIVYFHMTLKKNHKKRYTY